MGGELMFSFKRQSAVPRDLEKEIIANRQRELINQSNIDYIAMMSDIELEQNEEVNDNEQPLQEG